MKLKAEKYFVNWKNGKENEKEFIGGKKCSKNGKNFY